MSKSCGFCFFKNNQKLNIPYRDAIADILLLLDGEGCITAFIKGLLCVLLLFLNLTATHRFGFSAALLHLYCKPTKCNIFQKFY